MGQVQNMELSGTSSAELDFSIAETGKSCLGKQCDSHMTKCNLDETCRPILKRVLDTCDGGVDDACMEGEHQSSQYNMLFGKVYDCVLNSKCLDHYDWAKEHSSFEEISRRRSRRLTEGEGPMVSGTAMVSGSGKLFSDTVSGMDAARQPNPEYELGLIESAGDHTTIVINVNTDLDVQQLLSTTVQVQTNTDGDINVAVTTSTDTTVDAVREVAASMTLQGVTKKDFGAAKQLAFRKAVGKAVTVSLSKVTIESVSGLNLRQRRSLAESGILVSFKIVTETEEESFVIGQTMSSPAFITTLSTELVGSGVISDSSAQSLTFDKDSIVKRNIPTQKSPTNTDTEASDVEANTLNKTMVIIIVVLLVLVLILCAVGARKTSKVEALPTSPMHERKDVVRGQSKDNVFAKAQSDVQSEDVRSAQPARAGM